jgi:hypothetical protein
MMTLLAISAVVFARDAKDNPQTHARTISDANQLESIHQAMILYARDFNGNLPRPGMINRLADPHSGRHLPGRGPEDVSANTTAKLFSCMIAQNYIRPEHVVSPIERNPNVRAKAVDDNRYDYDSYDPVNDSYWDSDFKADLKTGSNVSYAHPPLVDPHAKLWRDDMRPDYAQLGNRGPRDGRLDPDSSTCGPHGHWAGNIVFGDNSVKLLTTTSPDELKGDNLFAAEKDRAMDSLLAFTSKVFDGKAELQFD